MKNRLHIPIIPFYQTNKTKVEEMKQILGFNIQLDIKVSCAKLQNKNHEKQKKIFLSIKKSWKKN